MHTHTPELYLHMCVMPLCGGVRGPGAGDVVVLSL